MLNFVLYKGDSPLGVYDRLEDCAPMVYGRPWSELTYNERSNMRYLASSKRMTNARAKRPKGFLVMPVEVNG